MAQLKNANRVSLNDCINAVSPADSYMNDIDEQIKNAEKIIKQKRLVSRLTSIGLQIQHIAETEKLYVYDLNAAANDLAWIENEKRRLDSKKFDVITKLFDNVNI